MSKEKTKFSNTECPKSVCWESPKKSWEPPKTEVKTRYEAVDRFLEDLGRVKDDSEDGQEGTDAASFGRAEVSRPCG
ncbi:MAG: hypothetical protein ACO2PN_16205 [Pyrobaculum sp.]|jgi:hypothetical protein